MKISLKRQWTRINANHLSVTAKGGSFQCSGPKSKVQSPKSADRGFGRTRLPRVRYLGRNSKAFWTRGARPSDYDMASSAECSLPLTKTVVRRGVGCGLMLEQSHGASARNQRQAEPIGLTEGVPGFQGVGLAT